MNPAQYLTERVAKVIVDSDKIFNEGARLLAHYPTWEYEIDNIVNESWDTLLRYCIRNKSTTYSASVKLTFASNLIGARIARSIGIDDTNIKSTLSLGDLLMESFLQDGLIEIFREYNGHKAPYMVKMKGDVDSVKPTLIGTVFEPPEPIIGLISPITKEPFIKGWTNKKLFHQYLDARFIKSLETLRQQPWEINLPVLEAMKANPPTTKLELVTVDGEIIQLDVTAQHSIKDLPKGVLNIDRTVFLGKADPKLQKLLSKYYEYHQIIRKADAVLEHGQPFYQEVSCDYRGRVYYAESFLEFQGSDNARSLFLFHNKKEMTEVGYRWLCIHTASCYNESYTLDELKDMKWLKTDYVEYLKEEGLDSISLDKMTLDDRAEWVEQNLSNIWFVAEANQPDPKAEKVSSFLACCIEIMEYQKHLLQGTPCMSGFPIPIDGSNNGWQHLAAISKDKQAGGLVSLTPSTIQKDFYVAVAKELITIMPDWFAERNIPMKHIRKGIAKRGSMTRAYSAGKQRIAKNMYDDCHMEGFTSKYSIDEAQCDVLAGNLIKAINTVCAGPLKTTKYLQKIAEHELNSGRLNLEWHTPSGFPVIYKAYLQHERKQRGTIKGIEGNKDGRVTHVVKVDFVNKEGDKVPCRRSFASGISPNVVHSYDAAHMANTIVSFNGSFAAVHDSFSCHADDVTFLQEVTKMTFIAQYDVPNSFELIEEALMLNKDSFQMDQPQLGDLDVNDVKDSEYFFC